MSILFYVSPNTGKYGPEKAPYLDTFHAVGINGDATVTVNKEKSKPAKLKTDFTKEFRYRLKKDIRALSSYI